MEMTMAAMSEVMQATVRDAATEFDRQRQNLQSLATATSTELQGLTGGIRQEVGTIRQEMADTQAQAKTEFETQRAALVQVAQELTVNIARAGQLAQEAATGAAAAKTQASLEQDDQGGDPWQKSAAKPAPAPGLGQTTPPVFLDQQGAQKPWSIDTKQASLVGKLCGTSKPHEFTAWKRLTRSVLTGGR